MRIAITGSHGFIGSALVPSLAEQRHTVIRLVRRAAARREGEAAWNPQTGALDTDALDGVDAVVHLAGESIVSGRWNDGRMQRIRDSRVDVTRKLCDALAKLPRAPKVLLAASAIGYYGDRDAEILHEDSPSGSGFLAETCRDWEASTARAIERGIRVVSLRTGIVLSPQGGALGKMLPAFRMGLGGQLGHGRQYMSWIALDDWLAAAHYALAHETVRGPANLVAPNPVTNKEFTHTLGRVLGRPTALGVPAFVLRLALGEMANEALLASARVMPSRLLSTGFVFRYPLLDGALRHLLSRPQ